MVWWVIAGDVTRPGTRLQVTGAASLAASHWEPTRKAEQPVDGLVQVLALRRRADGAFLNDLELRCVEMVNRLHDLQVPDPLLGGPGPAGRQPRRGDQRAPLGLREDSRECHGRVSGDSDCPDGDGGSQVARESRREVP